jgi:lipoate-protein ligase A
MALPYRLRAFTRHLSSTSKSHLTPTPPYTQTRCYTQHLHRRLQIYRSTSTDPYLNLSIEHHLLQRTHPDSTILFLYANRPSIVIGRNQNPWLEVNLHALRQGLPSLPNQNAATTTTTPISLVRRRSGGGTVFHDAGNTNWSVICPPAVFDRDKHAEMVVRALRQRLGVRGARVNERHDIVMDVVLDDANANGEGEGKGKGREATFKVSGSAYKLTRTRSLHHGTCLLGLEGLGRVGALLRSPAEGYIKARGVESVRSAIRNVGVGGEEFADAVVEEFRVMYGGEGVEEVVVGEEEALEKEEVVKGLRELTSPEWIFGQTPQFTFSTHPTEEDPRERPVGVNSSPHSVSTSPPHPTDWAN